MSNGKHELTPEQEAELAKWQVRADAKPDTLTPEQKTTWGFTKDTRTEEAAKDHGEHPGKGVKR